MYYHFYVFSFILHAEEDSNWCNTANTDYVLEWDVTKFRKDGKPYLSGSEYEFHRAWESRRRGSSKPEILVYRCKNETSSCADQAQLSNLNHFFQQPPFKENQQWQGSLNSYQTPNDFVGNLEGHLRRLLSQRQPTAITVFSDWLSEQATLIATNAGPRYTENAHVKTDIQQVFDWLLTRPSAISELDKALSEVWKQINHDNAFTEEHLAKHQGQIEHSVCISV